MTAVFPADFHLPAAPEHLHPVLFQLAVSGSGPASSFVSSPAASLESSPCLLERWVGSFGPYLAVRTIAAANPVPACRNHRVPAVRASYSCRDHVERYFRVGNLCRLCLAGLGYFD